MGVKNKRAKLAAFLRWADENGLDVDIISAIEMGYTERINLNVWFDREKPEAHRQLKRLFGPLVQSGEPPHVVLEGMAEIEDIVSGEVFNAKLNLFGAFECKITEWVEEEVTLPAQEAQPALPERTEVRKKPRYTCGPVAGSGADDSTSDIPF